METTVVYCDYIRIMEKKMETTVIYCGYIRIMEKKMETTILHAKPSAHLCKPQPIGSEHETRHGATEPYQKRSLTAFIRG